ncbi:hypothetical protein PoB_006866000 [Plakobranchus ocellatus]|uniref:Uncharacterized protein n=1 Tax=Plakobranchus ocellatus TaxID=259542 RepID=A0AAV4DDR1_9GAST|nr:hypothetical protein PoB_006866000 [Plakobranchus ocellatus]
MLISGFQAHGPARAPMAELKPVKKRSQQMPGPQQGDLRLSGPPSGQDAGGYSSEKVQENRRTFEGKRSRGRQREKIMDGLATWLGPGKVSDRDLWRDMIANAYKQGT